MVVLGHRHDEPGRVAFRIAHEAGHIAKGDCAPEAPVVDEDEEILSDDEMEKLADRYAIRALMGEATIPELGPSALGNFRVLANQAAAAARETGVDAGAIIFSWARTTGDYPTADQGHEGAVPRNRSHANPAAVLQEVRRRGGRVSE